jgi:hypothetical protein
VKIEDNEVEQINKTGKMITEGEGLRKRNEQKSISHSAM